LLGGYPLARKEAHYGGRTTTDRSGSEGLS
jgi:hypothetical protein